MDWKAQLVSSIEATVQASVQRSIYASVEESADETARRRTSSFGEAGRRRIELAEDRARRDPVWAERMARRHAKFAATTTIGASFKPQAVSSRVDISTMTPATCSTQCPSRAISMSVSAHIPSATPTPSTTTGVIVPERCCFDPEPAVVTSTTTSPLDVSGARSTGENSLRHGVISTTSTTTASVSKATSRGVSTEFLLDTTPTSVPVKAAMHETDHDSAMPTTSSTECLGSHISMSSGVCPANHATPSYMLLAAPLTAVTTIQRHDTMYVPSKELEVAPEAVITKAAPFEDIILTAEPPAKGSTNDLDSAYGIYHTTEAPSSMEDKLQIVPTLAEVYVSNMELTLLSPDTGFMWCSSGAVASRESNHSDADTFQSIINVGSVDLAIVTVPRNMRLAFVSDVASRLTTGLLAGVTIQNGSSASLEPDSCIFSKMFAERNSVTSVILHSLILAVTCDEAVLGPIFQFGTGNTILLLPWDPGQLLYGGGSKLGMFVMLSTASGVVYLQGDSIHELFSCSFVVEMIITWMLEFVVLQPKLSLDRSFWVTTVYHHPPPAKPPDKSTYISADKRVRMQWNILIANCSCNYSWLMHSATLFKFKLGAPQGDCCSSRSILMSEYAVHYGPIFENWFQPLSTRNSFLSDHGCEQFQWAIAWLINLDYISIDNKLRLPVQWDPSLQRSVELIQTWMMSFSLVELQAWPSCGLFLLVPIVQRVASEGCHETMLGKVIGEEASICLYCGRLHEKQLCWLPWHYFSCADSLSESFTWYIAWSQVSSGAGSDLDGSGTLSLKLIMGSKHLGSLCFFRFCTQAEAKGRKSVAAPTYCYCLAHAYYFDKVCADQDYYLNVFCVQVHIRNDYYLGVFLEQVDTVCYLNLVKVCLAYDTHRDLGEVMKPQVPWDPGGSTWHPLEDKPEFKERGMLATLLLLLWAGPWASPIGLWLIGSHGRQRLQIQRKQPANGLAWNGTASASSASVSSSLLFSFTSVMARTC